MTGTAVTCLVLLLVICIFLPYCYHKCACRNAGRADAPSPLLPKAARSSLYFLTAPVLEFHENDMEGFWNSECNIEFEQSPVEFIPEPVQVAIAESCPSYREALELNNRKRFLFYHYNFHTTDVEYSNLMQLLRRTKNARRFFLSFRK
jgi:hypothetical protein